MEIIIRPVSLTDAAEVCELSRQLGYPLDVSQIRENIQAIIESDKHNVFVAIASDKVVGWIGVVKTIMIESVPYCEINGLVIDENCRGKGIGKRLVEKAKQWASDMGIELVRLRCNVIRTETHKFYQHLGFTETKQQKNFEIRV